MGSESPKLPIINIMEKPHCTKGRENFGARRQARSSHFSSRGHKFFLLHTMCFPDQQVYPRNKRDKASSKCSSLLLLSPKKRGCSMPVVEWLKTGSTLGFKSLNQPTRLRSGLVTPSLLRKIQENQRPKMLKTYLLSFPHPIALFSKQRVGNEL